MRFLVPALLGSLLAAGCSNNGIGQKCLDTAGDGGLSGTAISSPALECPTRLCLLFGEGQQVTRQTCTAPCTTDDDCANATIGAKGATDGTCGSRFRCAVAAITGGDAIKCKTFCICQDDLKCGFNADGNNNPITPAGCPNASPTPNCAQ